VAPSNFVLKKDRYKNLKLNVLSNSVRVIKFRHPRVIEFYERILSKLKEKIDPLIRLYGMEKIA